ncbi:MAG: hypothetical protein HFACDABA_03156 [Anaerolineales bacterium]|nr:hypothetical protein [Anaerolineales bacterium]
MRIIRASEIGTYLYCRRAWHYHQQGVESANQADLNAGTTLHRAHGRAVLAASLTRTLGLILFLLALVLLTIFFVNALVG